jgi:hypothetical protein
MASDQLTQLVRLERDTRKRLSHPRSERPGGLSYGDVEAQHLCGRGDALSQLRGALNPPLPGGHLPRLAAVVTRWYQRRWCIRAQSGETSPRMIEVNPPRTMAVPI